MARIHATSPMVAWVRTRTRPARARLSAIITSMISFTGLVVSITNVVLQLKSSQFSPRVPRSFLEDRFNQVALGVFVATFVYALMVLRGVRGTAQVNSFVPQIGVTVAFVLAAGPRGCRPTRTPTRGARSQRTSPRDVAGAGSRRFPRPTPAFADPKRPLRLVAA